MVALPTRANYFLNCNGGPVPPCCQEVTACGPIVGPVGAFTDLLGWDNWWESTALCKDDLGDCGFMKARGEAVVRVRGVGSSNVLIRWDALAYTKERCDNAPGLYIGDGRAAIIATIALTVDGVPPGTPVTVYFRWKQAATNSYSPEAGAEDSPTSIVGGALTITSGGVPSPKFDTDFDLVDVKGGKFGPDVYGSFTTTTGSTVTIDTDVALRSTIRDAANPVPGNWPHRQCLSEFDRETVAWSGEIELSLNSAVPPPQGGWTGGDPGEPEPQPDMLFSVDLGGDAELADPTPEGDEVFDPGDAYAWMGPPIPPPGIDGVIDDEALAGGFDPTPDPGVPFFNEACMNTPLPVPAYFDLDDIDVLDAPLTAFIPIGAPLAAPIPRFGSNFIHRLEYSAISFEDDGPERFTTSFFVGGPYCSVPVGSPSGGAFAPIARTYGKSATEDEIELMTWTPGDSLPYALGMTSPGLDESSIHPNLAPDPDFDDSTDDDVDAIDILESGSDTLSAYTYFTADHEAAGPFVTPVICGPADPPGGCFVAGGTVYQRGPDGTVTPVIYPSVHLGLPDTTDIRALEFVWLTEGGALESLAMIFSVAPDDPGTASVDESAGLDPALLYYSFLTGAYTDLIAFPFDSPVDAFSNYRRALLSDPVLPPPPTPCPGDGNGDGVVNFADVTAALANWGNVYPGPNGPGDADHNGVVNFADVTTVLANWLLSC
jgi:hypothetical protein